MAQTVLVAGARTPIGKLAGALASLSAPVLGAHAIRGALGKAGVDADRVDSVIMGNVVQAGVGRQQGRIALTRIESSAGFGCLSGRTSLSACRRCHNSEAQLPHRQEILTLNPNCL